MTVAVAAHRAWRGCWLLTRPLQRQRQCRTRFRRRSRSQRHWRRRPPCRRCCYLRGLLLQAALHLLQPRVAHRSCRCRCRCLSAPAAGQLLVLGLGQQGCSSALGVLQRRRPRRRRRLLLDLRVQRQLLLSPRSERLCCLVRHWLQVSTRSSGSNSSAASLSGSGGRSFV